MKGLIQLSVLALALLLAGCTTVNNTYSLNLIASSSIGVPAFQNNSQTPMAGNSAAAITADVLRSKGAGIVNVYQQRGSNNLPGLRPRLSKMKLLRWARKNGMHYLLTGTVTEWRYKVGIDGEPAVGLTMQLVNVPTNQVVWSAVGSKIGTSRQSISGVAQRLTRNLLDSLSFS